MCNLAYETLKVGRDPAQIAELDLTLAPPEQKEQAQAEMNQQAMAQLGGFGLTPPPARSG